MEAELNRFVIYMTAERNFSPLTIELYKREINEFGGFLRGQGLTAWAQADRPVARKYLSWLASQGIAKGSMARRVAEVRSFYQFMLRDGILDVNPLAALHAPKVEKLLPEFLTVEETVALSGHAGREQARLACVTGPSWSCCTPAACASARSWG